MNILAIGCHPDDIEVGCGGTLAKYAAFGHKIYICHIANGNLGHKIHMPKELRAIRIEEAKKGGAILGAKEVITIDVGDLYVDSKNEDTLKKLIEVIRRVEPDLVIAHSPNDYMQDHVEASKLAFNATFASSVPHYETKTKSYDHIPRLVYMDTLAGIGFMPDYYVDISEYIKQKLEALNAHESQIKWMLEHDKIDFLDFVDTCSKFRGLQSSVNRAEAFKKCDAWPRIACSDLV